MTVLWIEAAKVLDVDVEHLGNLLQMKVFIDNHGVGLNRQLGHHRTDIVVAIVVHDVVGCDEGWHISACLLGEVGIDVPVIGRTFGAVDGLVDLVGATVVGSDDQAPVVENFIEVAQIVGGSIRGSRRSSMSELTSSP